MISFASYTQLDSTQEAYIKELIRSGKQEEGFRKLVNLLNEPIYWHVYRILESEEDAKDAVQTTFINAWKSWDKFRQDSKVKTWIYRIATNEALMLIRKRKPTVEVLENLQLYAFESINGEEIQEKLNEAINQLPEKQKMVFTMKYFDDMKYQEISEVLGTSVGGLKASYHLAVKKIEKQLNGD